MRIDSMSHPVKLVKKGPMELNPRTKGELLNCVSLLKEIYGLSKMIFAMTAICAERECLNAMLLACINLVLFIKHSVAFG